MISVCATKPIMFKFHGSNNTCAYCFLPVVKVNKAKHLAPVIHLGAFVFKTTPQGHVPEEFDPRIPVDAGALCRHQIGQPFCMGTSARRACRKGVNQEVLTHDRFNQCSRL